MAMSTSPWLVTVYLAVILVGVVVQRSNAAEPLACDPRDSNTKNLGFCRASLPVRERVRDLIRRLTLQEKVTLLGDNAAAIPRLGIKGYEWWSEALHGVSNVGPGTRFAPPFPAATSFPQVITTAASFNASLWEAIGRVSQIFLSFHFPGCELHLPLTDSHTTNATLVGFCFFLIFVKFCLLISITKCILLPFFLRLDGRVYDSPEMGELWALFFSNGLSILVFPRNCVGVGRILRQQKAVSDEARAMYTGGIAGLTFWSPNVNIFRDPRWGRGQETPGEDPVLAGAYAASYVKGLQGNDGNRLKVAACCKHFTAYDLENWNGVDRFHFNAQVSKQDIEDTFDVPFRMCVKDGKVASVMCSYNQVNGVPTCADPNHLKKTVRSQWGLDGYIVSDCDSVGVLFASQHYASSPEKAAAAAIKAGLDLDCGPFLALHTQDAVKKGLLREADVDGALANTLTVQMRLGMFDGEPSSQPYGKLGPADVCSAAHRELAHEAAVQGIVLLKNSGPSLPLSPRRHRTVAVIGPNSDASVTMIGNYAGVACGYITPLQGIGRYAKTIHRAGCVNVACADDKLFGAAVEAARRADATVLVMGLDQSLEAETRDRPSLLMPGRQQDLITQVATTSKGPTILVLMSGGPLDIAFAKSSTRVAGILWVGYPGQAGGAAIADILFGAVNPGGKLPMTWYPQVYLANLPMTDMRMRASQPTGYPGRTYRFYKGPVVYPFGHGLGYSQFVHTLASAPTLVSVPVDGHRKVNTTDISNKAIRVTHAKCGKLSMTLHVDVKNTGSKDGTHTLLVFSAPPSGNHWAPRKQLVAFHKVQVPAKAQQRVQVNIHVCKFLSVVDKSGIRRIPLGQHNIHVGDLRHSVSLQAQSLGIIKT